MAFSFNVLDEPWIPVVMTDGKVEDVGIRKALFNACSIERIRDDMPLQKMAVVRLLTAFLTDAYQLENRDARFELLNNPEGSGFSKAVIEEYIQKCVREHHASFDLLDAKHPFMSQPYDPKVDNKDPVSAIQFVVHAAKGNNTLHWSHKKESDFEGLCFKDALLNMLEQYLFAYGNAQYTPSLIGLGASFYMPEDSNLYRTLVRCMSSKREVRNNLPLSSSAAPCAWNNESVLTPKRPTAEMSLGFALTFEPRRIVLIPEDDQPLIKKCYFSSGWQKDKSDTSLCDPFVAYRRPKKGSNKKELKPCHISVDRELWRDIGNIAAVKSGDNPDRISPAVLPRINEDDCVETINVYFLGVLNNKASIDMIVSDRIALPEKLMNDPDYADRVRADMDMIDQLANLFYVAASTSQKTYPFEKDKSMAPYLRREFLARTKDMFVGSYLRELMDSDLSLESTDADLRHSLKRKLKAILTDVRDCADRNAMTWEELKDIEMSLRAVDYAADRILDKHCGTD